LSTHSKSQQNHLGGEQQLNSDNRNILPQPQGRKRSAPSGKNNREVHVDVA